jgi:uncharacterized protein YbjQ (UPF0145 family)
VAFSLTCYFVGTVVYASDERVVREQAHGSSNLIAQGSRAIIPGHVANTTAGAKGYSAPGFLVTTTSTLEGYKILDYKGVVVGAAVREPTWSENAAAGAQEPMGGSLDAYAQMCEEARQQAFTTLVTRAKEAGANAIVGIHFDSQSYQLDRGHLATGVVCVGTAVIVKPEKVAP